MVTGVEEVTALVLTVNVALVAPAGTVTLDGTVATPLLLESSTCAPPVGAAPLSVTVPVEGDPPVTLVGLSATEESVGDPGGLPLSQEKAQSERARGPANARKPGRWREVRIKLLSVNNTASQANNAANASHRRIGGAYRGNTNGGENARAVVVKVTVADAACEPSRVTEEGATVHVAWPGAPAQLQITV